MLFTSIAHAAGSMGAGGGGQAAGGSMLTSIAPLIIIFAIFYFLIVRPQQKKAKEHKAMLDSLKKGDEVLTSGGLYGTVVAVDGDVLTVDLGDSKVRVNRTYISNLSAINRQNEARAAKMKGKKGKDRTPEPQKDAEEQKAVEPKESQARESAEPQKDVQAQQGAEGASDIFPTTEDNEKTFGTRTEPDKNTGDGANKPSSN